MTNPVERGPIRKTDTLEQRISLFLVIFRKDIFENVDGVWKVKDTPEGRGAVFTLRSIKSQNKNMLERDVLIDNMEVALAEREQVKRENEGKTVEELRLFVSDEARQKVEELLKILEVL